MIRFAKVAAAAAVLVLAAGAPAIAAGPLKATDYAAILADPARPEADRKDDAARKPAEVLAFAQLRPGDTVLEIEVGRGWMTEIISRAVGPKGKVITQNPVEFTYSGPAMAARRTAGGLANVTDTTSRFDALQAPDASVDRVLWILGPHELYYMPKNSPGLGDPAKAYAEIARVLKPGGVFIAMDHAADAGAPTTTGVPWKLNSGGGLVTCHSSVWLRHGWSPASGPRRLEVVMLYRNTTKPTPCNTAPTVITAFQPCTDG